MNLRSLRIACLQKAAKDAKSHYQMAPAVGGGLTAVALVAWKVLGYDPIFTILPAVVLTVFSWVYAFGVWQGAAYIPSEDDVYDELQKLLDQPEVAK